MVACCGWLVWSEVVSRCAMKSRPANMSQERRSRHFLQRLVSHRFLLLQGLVTLIRAQYARRGS